MARRPPDTEGRRTETRLRRRRQMVQDLQNHVQVRVYTCRKIPTLFIPYTTRPIYACAKFAHFRIMLNAVLKSLVHVLVFGDLKDGVLHFIRHYERKEANTK